MKILSLLNNEVRRLLKDKGVIISLLLMPLVMILPTILNTDFAALDLNNDEKSKGG